MQKAQIATEFVLMVGLALVVVLALLAVLSVLVSDYSEEKNLKKLEDLGYSIQAELILASEVEPGYERSFEIPDRVGGIDYSLSQTANDMVIAYKGNEFIFPIPEVSGTLAKGPNTVRKTNANTIVIS